MCRIALMYCRLIKGRAEALSLHKQNEGEEANRVGIGSGSCVGRGRIWPWFLGKEGDELLSIQKYPTFGFHRDWLAPDSHNPGKSGGKGCEQG